MKYCMHYAYFRTNIRRKQVAKHTHKYPQLILKNIVSKNKIITNTYLYTFWYLHTEFYMFLICQLGTKSLANRITSRHIVRLTIPKYSFKKVTEFQPSKFKNQAK